MTSRYQKRIFKNQKINEIDKKKYIYLLIFTACMQPYFANAAVRSVKLPPATVTTAKGEPNAIEPALAKRADVLFFTGFENGGTDGLGWLPEFGMTRDLYFQDPYSHGANAIPTYDTTSSAFSGRSLQINLAKGSCTASDGFTIEPFFSMMGIPNQEEVYFRYYFKFGDNVDTKRLGGKIPGVGSAGPFMAAGGARDPSGTKGWSARIGWYGSLEDQGKLGLNLVGYPYFMKDISTNYVLDDHSGQGSYIPVRKDVTAGLNTTKPFTAFTRGQWYAVEENIKLNTPGVNNGVYRMWINDQMVIDRRNVPIRSVVNEDTKVGRVFLGINRGGSCSTDPAKDFSSTQDETIYIDNLVVATKQVGVMGATPPEETIFDVDNIPTVGLMYGKIQYFTTTGLGRDVSDTSGSPLNGDLGGPRRTITAQAGGKASVVLPVSKAGTYSLDVTVGDASQRAVSFTLSVDGQNPQLIQVPAGNFSRMRVLDHVQFARRGTVTLMFDATDATKPAALFEHADLYRHS